MLSRISILVVPVENDPIFQLGSQPIEDEVEDASVNHDAYLVEEHIIPENSPCHLCN
ncbi:hypothetical protein [Candidatus Electronema sp. PJ]|uniref:hypothetical protein n=1 Tax=Candidatus Electronema sp. PJ TaxID=3401572 RepID=UPI003AA7E98D